MKAGSLLAETIRPEWMGQCKVLVAKDVGEMNLRFSQLDSGDLLPADDEKTTILIRVGDLGPPDQGVPTVGNRLDQVCLPDSRPFANLVVMNARKGLMAKVPENQPVPEGRDVETYLRFEATPGTLAEYDPNVV